MRDKVKRFISILMTALMLVNLLPVGALAEGMKLDSNSVQSRASKKSANVYVYVKVTGDKAGLTINPSGWYTIGKSTNVPGMGTPYSIGPRSFNDVGVWPDTVLDNSRFTRWTDNQKIDINNITWTEFYIDNGADNYVKAGTYTWHMNGTIDIKQLPSVYTIKYVDYDTKKLIASYEKTGLMGQASEDITAPDSLQENLYSFYFVKGHPQKQTVDFTKDKGELTFYYKKNTAKLTINYVYKDGSKAAESHEAELPYQSDYSVESPVIEGYTANNLVVSGTMPANDVEVTVTYTKNSYNLKINYVYEDGSEAAESHKAELPYQSDYSVTSPDITGYKADKLDVRGTMPANDVEVTVTYTKRTDLSYTVNYYWNGTEDSVMPSKTVRNREFGEEVEESPIGADGYTPVSNAPKKITIGTGNNEITFYYYKNVELTANSKTETYDGNEHSVSGFTGAPDGVTFEGLTTPSATGTDAGTYPVKFEQDKTKPGYPLNKVDTTKKYIVTAANPGTLTINKRSVTLTSGSGEKVYDGTALTNGTVTVGGADGFVEGEGATYKVTGTQTNVGKSKNTFTYELNGNTKAINYTITTAEGELEVTPVTDEVVVTITGHNSTVTYNGSEQSVNGYDVSIAPEGVSYTTADFSFNGNAEAKGTDAGEYKMGLTAKNFENTNTNFSNVTFNVTDGWLKINPRPVTLTSASDEKVYDGNALTNDAVTVGGDGFAKGEGATYKVTGSQTNAGSSKNTFSYKLKDNTKAENYTITTSEGTLTVTAAETEVVVTITGKTKTETYNGNPYSVEGYTVTSISNDLYTEDDFEFTGEAKATGTEAGTYYMGLTAADFTNNDSTNFTKVTFVVEDGWLKIDPIDEVTVTITEKSGTATYDGGDHIVSGYASMTADNELYDVDASVQETPTAAWTVKGKDAGEYPVGIKADDFKNTNGNFTNVKFVVVDGKLTITPAPVTLQAPIQSKTYDGTPLEATQFGHSYLEGVNFADDFASVILTGSQTLVGSSASLITGVIPNEGKKLTNYNFTFVPGTLTVTDGTGEEEKPVDPAKVITKTHIPKDMGYNLGEPVTFTISVKNIYNTPKTITLTEKENVKFSNGESVIVFNDVPAGETVTAEATYTITSEDILEGVFTNTVTADFTGGGSWTAKDTVTTAKLDTTLNVTKTSNVPDGQKAALGQTITYTIKVENAGNVPYTNVKVEDPLTKLTATIETLAVGETKTFTTEYVVTEADVLKGSVLNTATAKGDKIKDPASDEKQKEPNGGNEVETPTFAPITIKPKDVTATYNGAAITGKDVEITSGKLLEGHKLSAAVDGSGVNAGSYELTLDPEKITIVDANNKDVSEMYARTILPGKLIINKRSVLITSQSATKTYDGSALTRPAVTITGDGFAPGELAKAEATGSITKVGSTPNAIQYTTTGAFNAANYSIALSVGTLTVTEKPKPEPRRTFNLTINYVYQNGKRAAASYNRGGLKNGETFDITSPVIAGYTASETVVSGTIYNRDIKVTVIYTADGVNLDDYGVPLGLGNITMNVGDCFE